MNSLYAILHDAFSRGASDVMIVAHAAISYRINRQVAPISEEKLTPEHTKVIVREAFEMANNRDMSKFEKTGDDDFSISIEGLGRFRCNAYEQRNTQALVLRTITAEAPDPSDLNIPPEVMEIADGTKGLVLVTGVTGSGKSSTLACMIDRINKSRQDHIVTLEDPIEFVHPHKKCVISQREINTDTEGYHSAMRAVLRQAPDVILIGEMRDFETIQSAIMAAETGHLVFATLHTSSASRTIDRIIDVFPPNQQQQIRIQLATALEAVISQQLIMTLQGILMPAFEIMKCTPAIRNLIREQQVHQINNVLATGTAQGMRTMDMDLHRLYMSGHITQEDVIYYSPDPEQAKRNL